jgi:hypothetical protein
MKPLKEMPNISNEEKELIREGNTTHSKRVKIQTTLKTSEDSNHTQNE